MKRNQTIDNQKVSAYTRSLCVMAAGCIALSVSSQIPLVGMRNLLSRT